MKRMAKITAFFATAFMLMALVPAAMADGYAVTIDSVSADNGIVTGADVTVNEAGSYTLYAALYDGDSLNSVASKEFTGSGTVTFNKSLHVKTDEQTLRVYVWDADMRPAAAFYENDNLTPAQGDGIIHLNGSSIDAEGVDGAAVDGTTVTLSAGNTTYYFEGSLTDGKIVANVDGDITLDFTAGVDVSCLTDAALTVKGGKVEIVTSSENDCSFTSTAGKGITSKKDLTISGGGKITVNSAGNGIDSGKDLKIKNCSLDVTAGKNGLKGDKSVTITKNAGTINVTAAKDGISSDLAPSLAADEVYTTGGTVEIKGGTITITAGDETTAGDGIQADTLLAISGGNITVNATGEALKANASSIAYIEDGTDQATTQTDAQGDGCISISGGTLNLTAGEDGIKAVKNVAISGGSVTITKAQDGIQVKEIVYDTDGTTVLGYVEGSIDITGGAVNVVTASEDGIQCGTGNITISDGNITVNSTQDGIQAEYLLYITGGTFDVKTNGGSPETIELNGDKNGLTATDYSCKGLKASELIYITGGSFNLDTYDDAIHTNHTVRIKGGEFAIETGDDGVHGDKFLVIDNGTVNVTKCYEGLEAAEVYVNGGESRLNAKDDGINSAGENLENGDAPLELSDYSLASDISTYSYTLMAGPGGNGPGGNNPPGGNGGNNQGPGQDPGGSDSPYGYLEVNGGYIYVTNENGDGLDSNGNLVINDGVVIVDGATRASEDGLDFGTGVELNGGYVFTMTAGGMDTISGTKQQAYRYSTVSIPTGNYCIVDSSNNVLCAFSRTKGTIGRITISCPPMSSSGTYTVKPLSIQGATAVDSLYGTINSSNVFSLASGCTVGSGTSYTLN